MEATIALIFLATFVEGLVNYIFGDAEGSTPRKYVKFIALGIGVLCCIMFKVSIPDMFGLNFETRYEIFEQIFSGLIIGRGSNYLNDIMGLIKNKKRNA